MATVWAAALPSGDVCATGGYDALVTCWRVSGAVGNRPPAAVISATPTTGVAPLTVSFDGSASTDPDGTVKSWAWSFGDGSVATGSVGHARLLVAGDVLGVADGHRQRRRIEHRHTLDRRGRCASSCRADEPDGDRARGEARSV